ncbi:hypothetical protein QVD17_04041 [Tagetes erecta]|uniref:Uncharacterized protein n=1 Tax=Tagetes erecta TaxID=13708 RepID=A0AAD8LIT1_TARER|nr:hypothetical protein QVD17_04041 [Tagetes erecta]
MTKGVRKVFRKVMMIISHTYVCVHTHTYIHTHNLYCTYIYILLLYHMCPSSISLLSLTNTNIPTSVFGFILQDQCCRIRFQIMSIN